MYESKTEEALRTAGNNPGHLAISRRAIGMKGGKQDCLMNARHVRAAEVHVQGRVGIPRTCQSVTLSRMAMAINNQSCRSLQGARSGRHTYHPLFRNPRSVFNFFKGDALHGMTWRIGRFRRESISLYSRPTSDR